MKSIAQLLEESVERFPEREALCWKTDGQWVSMTYRELLDRSRRVSRALADCGVRPGACVAFCLENHPRWPELYFGIVGAGATAVPMDPKLSAADYRHLMAHSGCVAAFAGASAIREIGEAAWEVPTMRRIVACLETLPPFPDKQKTVVERYDDFVDCASGCDAWAFDSSADDAASIIYTSGTTGRPKGVVLTHGNFTSNVDSCRRAVNIRETDRFMVVLPLHHVFAFTTNLLLPVGVGGAMILAENIKSVADNIRETSPTAMMAVPLLLEKMYGRIMKRLQSNRLGYTLFRLGLKGPVRKKVRAGMGGDLRLMIAGGAASEPEVLNGFRDFGITILEGYGLTEAAPVLSLNPEDAPRVGTVGKPLPGVELSIQEPNAEGIGEIVARGPNIMQGYYRDEEATGEVLRDGRLYTGDLGQLSEDGYLTITGRKKNLIVNREGKNIYPEEIEACLLESPYILEALALGIPLEGVKGEKVVVIVVPDFEALNDHPHARNAVTDDEALRECMMAEIKRRVQNLSDFKRPRSIRIRREEFEKTPTGKIKRYLYAMAAEGL